MNSRLDSMLDRVAAIPRVSRRGWSIVMMVAGLGAVAASFVFTPGDDNWTYFFGNRFGGPCGFREATSLPCPSCGMTRSWVWLVRGEVLDAFRYNAAGALLLIGLAAMGVIGAVRVVTGDPERLKVDVGKLSAIVVAWMIVPYLGGWILRMLGFNPLP